MLIFIKTEPCARSVLKNNMLSKCFECKNKKILNSNNLCTKCNANFGLKECAKCHELKFILLDFGIKSRKQFLKVCRDCATSKDS